MMPHEWAADAELIRKLAAGELPEGVRPDTAEGRHYARLIATVAADIADTPPLTQEQLSIIIPMLRGVRVEAS